MDIELCLSPEEIQLFDLSGKIVVIADILRATSCMVAGLANGVKEIRPVATVEEARSLGADEGYLTAGERKAIKVEGFDFGNSPYDYMSEKAKGNKIAMSTTNGTRAISLSAEADQIVIGSFLNLSAVAKYIREQGKDVVLFSAGWRGRFSLEDTLFGGGLAVALDDCSTTECDAVFMAKSLYQQYGGDLQEAIRLTAHSRRLKKLGDIEHDLTFCAKKDLYDIVPVLENGSLYC